jgi:hypothetical protein
MIVGVEAPNAIQSDSPRYPFGYWKRFTSGMHFGPPCDKTFSTEWETLIAP